MLHGKLSLQAGLVSAAGWPVLSQRTLSFRGGVCALQTCWQLVGPLPFQVQHASFTVLALPMQVPEECPVEIRDLIEDCTEKPPAERPTANQAFHRIKFSPDSPSEH